MKKVELPDPYITEEIAGHIVTWKLIKKCTRCSYQHGVATKTEPLHPKGER